MRQVGEAFNDKKARIVSVVGTQMVVQLENAKFSQLLESERKQREIAGELATVRKRLEEVSLSHQMKLMRHSSSMSCVMS